MGFARQEQWSGLPFHSPGDLPDPGIEPASPVALALAGGFFTMCTKIYINTHTHTHKRKHAHIHRKHTNTQNTQNTDNVTHTHTNTHTHQLTNPRMLIATAWISVNSKHIPGVFS